MWREAGLWGLETAANALRLQAPRTYSGVSPTEVNRTCFRVNASEVVLLRYAPRILLVTMETEETVASRDKAHPPE